MLPSQLNSLLRNKESFCFGNLITLSGMYLSCDKRSYILSCFSHVLMLLNGSNCTPFANFPFFLTFLIIFSLGFFETILQFIFSLRFTVNLSSNSFTATFKSLIILLSELENQTALRAVWPSAIKYARSFISHSLKNSFPNTAVSRAVAILLPFGSSCAGFQPSIVSKGCSGVNFIFLPLRIFISSSLSAGLLKNWSFPDSLILYSWFKESIFLESFSRSFISTTEPSARVMNVSPLRHLPPPLLPQISIRCGFAMSIFIFLPSTGFSPELRTDFPKYAVPFSPYFSMSLSVLPTTELSFSISFSLGMICSGVCNI